MKSVADRQREGTTDRKYVERDGEGGKRENYTQHTRHASDDNGRT